MKRRTNGRLGFGREIGLLGQTKPNATQPPVCNPWTNQTGPLAGRLPGDYPVDPRTCVPSLPPSRSGGVIWTPRSLTSLTRWFTASAITGLSNGDPVLLWPDSSAYGVDATQFTTSKKPTYVASAVNAQPGVYFDGVDDLMLYTLTNIGTAHTMFFVFERFSTTGRTYVGGQGSTSYFMVYLDATDWGYYAGNAGAPGNAFVPHGGIPTSTWTILALRRSGTSVEVYRNGTQLGTTQTIANNVDMEVSAIGARSDGNFHADTTIADLILCDQALGDSEMAQTWTYLNNLYGVY